MPWSSWTSCARTSTLRAVSRKVRRRSKKRTWTQSRDTHSLFIFSCSEYGWISDLSAHLIQICCIKNSNVPKQEPNVLQQLGITTFVLVFVPNSGIALAPVLNPNLLKRYDLILPIWNSKDTYTIMFHGYVSDKIGKVRTDLKQESARVGLFNMCINYNLTLNVVKLTLRVIISPPTL